VIALGQVPSRVSDIPPAARSRSPTVPVRCHRGPGGAVDRFQIGDRVRFGADAGLERRGRSNPRTGTRRSVGAVDGVLARYFKGESAWVCQDSRCAVVRGSGDAANCGLDGVECPVRGRADLKPGETVLVQGSGGVQRNSHCSSRSAAGARVFAITRSPGEGWEARAIGRGARDPP